MLFTKILAMRDERILTALWKATYLHRQKLRGTLTRGFCPGISCYALSGFLFTTLQAHRFKNYSAPLQGL